jgi:hypothetical protein
MPTNRFQFSDDFVLNNGNVGINSSSPQEKLDVVGVVKGQDLKVIGVSSFTTYEGFLNSNQNIIENVSISNGSESGSLSGEIIVGTGITVTVASGTTSSQGNIDSLKVYNTFTVPTGGTVDRPSKSTPGQLFYNKDFKTIEFWDGNVWRQVDNTTQRGRGVFGGGDTPTRISTIDYINISSTGNAVNFGNLTQSRSDLASGVCASSIRGIFAHGSAPPTSYNIIDYVTIASEGNAIDFGDSTQTTTSTASCSSSTRGLFAGVTNTIDYITIATIGNALDFGDLSQTRSTFSACSSSTRGVFGGGASPTFVSTIDFVTIASTGNAVDFGDLSQSVRAVASCSSSTRGLFAGGNTSPGVYPALIDFITISSTGNAVKFGDLTAGIWFAGSCSSNIRGVFGGGSAGPAVTNIISYVTIATTGNAQDFGDLTQARNAPQGTSDSHGGLGGF